MFKRLLQSRADHSYERDLVKVISHEMLIIDIGLQKLTSDQAGEFYEVVIEQYGRSSTVIKAIGMRRSECHC
jgi:DNA replication protein DnaC